MSSPVRLGQWMRELDYENYLLHWQSLATSASSGKHVFVAPEDDDQPPPDSAKTEGVTEYRDRA